MSDLEQVKRAGGRPREREEAKRAAVAVRTTPAIKQRLVQAAMQRGSSVTQEIERRIELSFEDEDRAGGQRAHSLFQLLAADIKAAEMITMRSWESDVTTWSAALHFMRAHLNLVRPPRVNEHAVEEALGAMIPLEKAVMGLLDFLKDTGAIKSAAEIDGSEKQPLARKIWRERGPDFESPLEDLAREALTKDASDALRGENELLERTIKNLAIETALYSFGFDPCILPKAESPNFADSEKPADASSGNLAASLAALEALPQLVDSYFPARRSYLEAAREDAAAIKTGEQLAERVLAKKGNSDGA